MIDQLGKLFSLFYLLLKKPSLFQNPPSKKGKRKKKKMSHTDPEFKRKISDKQARVSKAVKKKKKKKLNFQRTTFPSPNSQYLCFNSVLGFKDQNKKNESEL